MHAQRACPNCDRVQEKPKFKPTQHGSRCAQRCLQIANKKPSTAWAQKILVAAERGERVSALQLRFAMEAIGQHADAT